MPEEYLEPTRTSTMKFFEKKGKNFQLLTIFTKISILDIVLRSEYATGIVDYFRKNFYLKC